MSAIFWNIATYPFILLGSLLVLASRFNHYGYSVRIKKIRPLSLYGLYFSHQAHYSISASHIQLRFHFPRSTNPRWATFEVFDYEYKDPACHVSISLLQATLWLMPVYFGFTGGSWIVTELNDFRLRIFASSNTPTWVSRMRKDLVTTVLTGEILRVDDFKTKLSFGSLTGAPEGPVEHLAKNFQERLYAFTSIQAQLRRNWVDGKGSYVMIAEGGRWTKVGSINERCSYATAPRWKRLLLSFGSIPFDLFRICKDPMSTVDLIVPRADIAFDHFRIRDAELLRQSVLLLSQKLAYNGIDVMNFPSMLIDALL